MKITKVKTKFGEFGAPVSIELSAVAEQMRSETTREAAGRITAVALRSRLAMQQGAPRYHIKDSDRLPYLIFSATFGKSGLGKPIGFTGLVMLNIPCPQGGLRDARLMERTLQAPRHRPDTQDIPQFV